MSNKILENVSFCNMVLSACVDFDTGVKSYKKDDVVAIFKEVPFVMNHKRTEVEASTTGLKLYYEVSLIEDIFVGSVPLDENLVGLFASEKQEKANQLTIIEAESVDDVVFLPTPPNFHKPFRILDGAKNLDVDYTYDPTMGSISFAEPVENGTYKFVYFTKTNKMKTYTISSPSAHIPYLKLYMSVIGNVDKVTGTTDIEIPRVAIANSPVLGVSKSGVGYFNLQLKVIDSSCKIGF